MQLTAMMISIPTEYIIHCATLLTKLGTQSIASSHNENLKISLRRVQ